MVNADETTDWPPETAPPLPAQWILDGFRDLGVPDEPSEKLACEPSFNRYTAYWVLGNTLDAGYAALEGMLWAWGKKACSRIEELKPKVLLYLAKCFDDQDGRFATDSSDRTRGLFATHTAIGVMRSLEGGHSSQRLTWKRFVGYLEEMGFAVSLRGIEELKGLLAASRRGDAVIENPDKPLIPTLTALYTASSILWCLGDDEDLGGGLTNFIEPRRLERFLFGCLKRQRLDDGWVSGFAIHPDHSELCVNTTFFGLKLMERLGVSLEPGCDLEIEAFLTLSCKDGGFSSTRPEPRSLNATYWGLRALRMVAPSDRWTEFVTRRRGMIKKFVRSCWNRPSGGARFATDLSRYAENCLATRYWLQIHKLADLELADQERDTVFEFFRAQFDDRTGGFRAYPQNRVDLSGFGPEDLERFLEDKDDKLLHQHTSRLYDPARPPSYFPDTRLIDLYERLADLEHEKSNDLRDPAVIDRDTERIWQELRACQEAEAARFEACFDAEILRPLRSGRAELAALRERIADR